MDSCYGWNRGGRASRVAAAAAVIVVMSVLAGCENPTANDSIVGAWRVVSVQVGSEEQLLPHDQGRFMTSFSTDGQFSGEGACNDYRGAFEVRGRTLVIQEFATQARVCSGEQMALDSTLTAAFRQGVLELSFPSSDSVIVEAKAASISATLSR
jgi:heat shock protein HslJ